MDSPTVSSFANSLGRPTTVALAYRWATLIVGLLIALLAATRPGGERAVLLAPIVLALLISWLALRHGRSLAVWLALGAEVVVAAVAIWLTGYHDSPLVLYLTAPLVHAALVRDGRLVAGLTVLALTLFIGIVAIDPGVFRPGATIHDIAILILVPGLVLATASLAADRVPSPQLELAEQDLAVAAQLAEGRTYNEMADELDLSPETVKVAVARLYRRLGARNRDEAVSLVRRWELLDEDRSRRPT